MTGEPETRLQIVRVHRYHQTEIIIIEKFVTRLLETNTNARYAKVERL